MRRRPVYARTLDGFVQRNGTCLALGYYPPEGSPTYVSDALMLLPLGNVEVSIMPGSYTPRAEEV